MLSLAGALCVALLGTTNAFAATFLSDTNANAGPLAHFHYSGRWEHVRNMRDGRLYGTSSRTATPGSIVTLFFFGSNVRIYGVRGPGGGRGILTIDGQRYVDVDFYAPAKVGQAVVYASPRLRRGKHFLVIVAVGGSHDGHRHSSYINISGASFQ